MTPVLPAFVRPGVVPGRRLPLLLAWPALLLCLPLPASAQPDDDERAVPAADATGESPSAKAGGADTGLLSGYRSWKQDLKRDGFDFDVNYTSEDLVAAKGGDNDKVYHAGQLSFTGQADMARLVGWDGASILVSVSHRDGRSINSGAGIGSLLGPQEIFGRGNVTRLSQFWLDQRLLGDRLSIRVGRVNPGSDFEAFDCNFINLSYCGNQVGNIVSDYWYNYPIGQWGAIAELKTGANSYVKAGAYQVNPTDLKRGLVSTLDPSGGTGTLVPFEFGWTPRLGSRGEATVKLGGWRSTASRNDVYLDANRDPAAATGLAYLQRGGSYGGYVSLVAKVPTGHAGDARSLTAFFNATLADRRTSSVDQTFAAGLVYTGPFPGRPKDQVGLAVSYNHLNSRLADYRRESLALGHAVLPPGTGENAVELYYGFQVTSFLQFRPDVQWIRHPGGIAANPNAVIGGARTSITF